MASSTRAVAATLLALSGMALVALELWVAPDMQKTAPTAARNAAAEPLHDHDALPTGTSFVQTGASMGRLRTKGMSASSYVRAVFGTILVLSASVFYMLPAGGVAREAYFPTLVGHYGQRRSSKVKVGEFIADFCAPVGDLCVDSGAGARVSRISDAIIPPPGLGDQNQLVAEAPLRKLAPLTKLGAIAEERTAARKEIPQRNPVPGRGAFQDLFRESRRAFQEADAELAAEALRAVPVPAGAGVWQ